MIMMVCAGSTALHFKLFIRWLLIGALCVPSAVSATVYSFDENGKMIVHEAVDYRHGLVESAEHEPYFLLRAVSPEYNVEDYGPKFETLIRSVASEYKNIDFDLLNALIAQESAYDACAVSSKGAMGLAQLMPATAIRLGVTDRCDPSQSVRAGAKELSRTIEKFDSLSLGLAAYNASDEAVEKYGGIPPYAETQDYVVRILSRIIAAQERQEKFK